ncbi:tetratricopeptide repeat protein [Amycolatopsis sp. H6(2020)]|nr:tetratricopeptide repeat protein [Amycolatopsis sp. H6(2020)]
MALSHLLRTQRSRLGITQEDLAQRAGVSVRTLRDIERGAVHRPHDRSVRRLLAAAGLDEAGPPTAQLQVDVLGPLALSGHGRQIELGSALQRRLLGLLALEAGKTVPQADIVEFLWGDDLPRSADALVHTHVSRLRRSLAGGGAGAGPVERAGSGYRLGLDPAEIDVGRFRALTARATGRRIAGETERAAADFEAALALWRGEVLAGDTGHAQQHPVLIAVTQHRLRAALEYADLALELGRHVPALDLVRAALRTDPLHEPLHARLLRLLVAAGRRAAALRHFEDIRRQLRDELGIEPGTELRAAHLAGLRDGPDPAPVRVVPAQLPPDTATFTGRAGQIRSLDAHVFHAGRGASARVAAISGTGGVGKTALALHWAHRVRRHFPDGQLYFDLRGCCDLTERTADDAVTCFLPALGVSPANVPVDPAARLSLLRSLLADRRTLMVLDNAADPQQVRPLVPASGGSAVVVTGRTDLSGLMVHHDALVLDLDVFAEDEAVSLLTALLGPAAGDDPGVSLARLARLCAFLPLALRIAAALLLRDPGRGLDGLLAELGQGDMLTALAVGARGDSAVRATFEVSYRALPPAAAHLFRLSGLVPGDDADLRSLAALVSLPEAETAALLHQLVAAHLLQRRPSGRYQTHDLLRLFARQQSEATDDGPARRAALDRLLDHYLRTAEAASAALYPSMLRLCPTGEAATAWSQPLPPLDWLRSESANLAAAVLHAAEHGPRRVAWQLTDVLRGFLRRDCDLMIWRTMAEAGLEAARAEQDRTAEAAMLYSLGAAHRYAGCELAAAARHLGRAQRMFGRLGVAGGQAAALDSLGVVRHGSGDHAGALAALEESLTLCRTRQLKVGEAKVLCNLGLVLGESGRTDEALRRLGEAEVVIEELGNRRLEATALHNSARVHRRRGDHGLARRTYERALAIRTGIGDAEGRGTTLDELAELLAEAGDTEAARRLWAEALDVFGSLGHPRAAELRARLDG